MNYGKSFSSITLIAFLLINCSHPLYSLKYKLDSQNVVNADMQIPFRVQVCQLTDKRDNIERYKSARDDAGFSNTFSYTYDNSFKYNISKSITQMIIAHLEYTSVFKQVSLSKYKTEQINNSCIKEIHSEGFDAILIGDLENFYGYYEQNESREAIYKISMGMAMGLGIGISVAIAEYDAFNPISAFSMSNTIATTFGIRFGFSFGNYIESLYKRNTEAHTRLSLSLINTSTGDQLWHEVVEIKQKKYQSIPSTYDSSSSKMWLAVNSLRDVIESMIESLVHENSSLQK